MAVRFSASGQNYTATLSGGSQANRTLACWGKVTNDRNDVSTFVDLNVGSTTAYTILQTDATGTALRFSDDGAVSSTIALTLGTWYFMAASLSGSSGTLYARALGATSWTTVALSGHAATSTATSLLIGEDVWAPEWLDGCVTGVKVWYAALTQAELELEWLQHMPARTANLAAWYPLLTTETADYSGNARTLSGGSGAAVEDGPGISWRQQVIPRISAATAAATETNFAGPYTGRTPGYIGPTGLWVPASVDPSIINVNPETTTGVGTAFDATVSDTANAETTTGTGTALAPTTDQTANAETTTGTGTALDAQVDVDPNAETTTGTGAAFDATAFLDYPAAGPYVGLTPGYLGPTGRLVPQSQADTVISATPSDAASATGAASDATVDVDPNAETTTATGVASDITPDVTVNAETISATGTAFDATAFLDYPAAGPYTSFTPGRLGPTGLWTIQPQDQTPSGSVSVPAETTTATGVAFDATVDVDPNAETTTAAGVASDITPDITVNAETTTGSGAALDATAFLDYPAAGPYTSFTPGRLGPTGLWTVQPQDQTPTGSLSSSAELASATGTAFDATVDITTNAETTTGTGAAFDATASVGANAETTTGSGAANDASPAFAVNAETTTGTGSAFDAQAALNLAAELASATGITFDAAIALVVSAEAALASGTGNDGTVPTGGSASPTPDPGTGGGTAYDATALYGPRVGHGSWYGLLEILREGRELTGHEIAPDPVGWGPGQFDLPLPSRSSPQSTPKDLVVACKYCGEPMRPGPRGESYCAFDGWQPDP